MINNRRVKWTGLALTCAALLTACDGDGATTPFGDSATDGTPVGTSGGSATSGGSTSAATAVTAGSDSNATTTATTTTSGPGETTESDSADDTTGDASGADTTSGTGSETGDSTTGPVPDCVDDVDCDPGSICEASECVPGCTGRQPCADGFECCEGECIDINTDLQHCGACGNVCELPDDQAISCDGKSCVLGECDDGFFDCDGNPGCESEIECTCTPGEEQPCYPGPAGTEGIGICTGGTQACNPFGTGWGACVDFVLPAALEVCGNGLDDDCNGAPDDVVDVDGDGWTYCDNDCCEDEFECGDPALVNPGAFEFVGNGVDDDCDPATSDVVDPGPCSAASIFGGVTAADMAEAMDICQTTSLVEPLETRKWGLISAEFLDAEGNAPVAGHLATIMDSATAVMTDYGTGGVGPTTNNTMAGMSSGWMRDAGDPGYVQPNGGANFGWTHQPPAGYLAANGGNLPASASCNGACPAGAGANDSVRLRLTLRVPTNALSFSYDFRFFSSEYWTYACTEYNDFYLALLDSMAGGIPADGNISFDSNNNPVSVNNGFFEHCVVNGCYTCPGGAGVLAGTGMEVANTGGGTVWLTTSSPIVPGEVMTLDLMIFDVSDNVLDSLVLLDGFQWSIDPSDVGTEPQ
jgi:hypothetical protein